MAFLRICKDDQLSTILRETFRANIIRIPDEVIIPLSIVAKKNKNTRFLGNIDDLLVNPIVREQENDEVIISDMPDISGKYTKSVSLDIGMQILEGFLKGFNIPAEGIEQQLSGVNSISFSFKSVRKLYIPPARIGHMLSNSKIDKKNKVSAIFFDKDPFDILIVDSVIQSKDFSIKLEHEDNFDLNAKFPEIQSIVTNANANVNVKTTSSYDIIFTGNKHLTFAFSCFNLVLKENGCFASITPDFSNKIEFNRESRAATDIERVVLYKKPGLIDWDDEPEVNKE
jgi:hypothetical protein